MTNTATSQLRQRMIEDMTVRGFAETRRRIEACGARLLFLPPYSPDLNPIEMAFAKLKAGLRKAGERSVDQLWDRIGSLLETFTQQECANYFRHAGYA